MTQRDSTYRQMLKATSIFGGVQVINILIAIIRSKFIAILLGPAGMGISGLLTATTGLIGGLTNFGLGTSAIKDIAAAHGTGDEKKIATVIIILRRWVWVTGLLGMVITLFTAPLLSQFTFGNSDYTWPFVWISVSLLLSQLSSGQMILLQGMRKIQHLAKANLVGSVLGLIVAIPLYYFMGAKGIVPGIIIASVMTFVICSYFAGKIKTEPVQVSRAMTIEGGKGMLAMGFMMSVTGMITLGASYVIRIFIGHQGGVDQVGLYNAGFSIVNSYVGLIFVAMGTDYYPRLSSVAHSNAECTKLVNQQTEISVLIMGPIIILFLVFINWVVILLYSSKFAPVKDMILWAALGMFFKAATWAVGHILLAKGDSKLFLKSEFAVNVYMLLFNVAGYYLYGLTGLGVSFLVGYAVNLIQSYIITRNKYEFDFKKDTAIIFCVQFILAVLSFLPAIFIGGILSYVIGVVIFLCSLWYSYVELDKRIGISLTLTNLFARYKK